MNVYEELLEKFREIVGEEGWAEEQISVDIRSLSSAESIGEPLRRDFPLLTGKEAMVEANFRGSRGQAFTLCRAAFTGNLSEVLSLDLKDPFNKALFISTLNAVLKYMGKIHRTVHCKNEEPESCAKEMARTVEENFRGKNVALVGYQPAILEALTKVQVQVRNTDLNPDNVGEIRYGVKVEHGIDVFDDVTQWADILLVTGSTLTNGSIETFLSLEKPVIFYGNTIAGAAYLLNLPRLCFKAS